MAKNRARRLAEKSGKGDGKAVFAVLGIGALGTAAYLYFKNKTPAWIEVTGQAGFSIPAGSSVALAANNPDPTMLAAFAGFMSPQWATVASNVVIYPVGTAAPAGFPADGFGTTAVRATGTLLQAMPVGGANSRTWYHA